MKFIHTADIHLDSPLVGVFDGTTRRYELIKAVAQMSDYADKNGVNAIVVAGDLFDDKYVSDSTVKSIADVISRSHARWFVLRGNHGSVDPYRQLYKICNTVAFFDDDWTTYRMGNVVFCGKELDSNAVAVPWGKLPLDSSDYNVVVLHGDVDSDAYGFVDNAAIAANPINYVAFGHRHKLQKLQFGNNKGAYSGVLEARGFDETEPTGFLVVDTDADTVSFVPQAIRRVDTKIVDLSSADSDIAVEQILLGAVADVDTNNYLNVILQGRLPQGVRAEYIAHRALDGKYFALRVKNETAVLRNLAALADEVSLRGEFVKLALQIEDETERKKVLDMGLSVLAGEELQ